MKKGTPKSALLEKIKVHLTDKQVKCTMVFEILQGVLWSEYIQME